MTTVPPCLFCKRTDRKPSVEHVFPAGLGMHADETLPRGAVCEPCNNLLGRQVDEALVHHSHALLIRGLFQVPDQNGKVVDRIVLRNGTLTFGPDGALEVQLTREGDSRFTDPGTLAVKLITNRRHSGDQMRRVARAVMKLGLNLVYLRYGPAIALEEAFDPVREAVHGEPYDGYLLIGPFDVHRAPDLEGSVLHDLPGVPRVCGLALRRAAPDRSPRTRPRNARHAGLGGRA